MELGRYLTVNDFNELSSDIGGIIQSLDFADYDSPENPWIEIYKSLPTVNWYTQPTKIKSEIFDKMEKILYDIDSVVDWVNPYSRDLFVYAAKNGMLYPFVKRWFDWVDYNFGIIGEVYQKQQYLFTNEPNEQVYDINGDPILTLEGYF